MRNFKRFGLLTALAATALMAFAGIASAVTFTSPANMTYDGGITATSTNMALSGPFITVKCSHSQIKVEIDEHGSATDAGGPINSLTFTGCNYTVTVKNNGSMDVNSKGKLDLFNTQFTVHTSVGECVFTADSAFFGGTEMGQMTGGKPATIHFSPGEIPRTGGSFFCGSVGYWTGNYTVTSPSELWVH